MYTVFEPSAPRSGTTQVIEVRVGVGVGAGVGVGVGVGVGSTVSVGQFVALAWLPEVTVNDSE
jgi:hypothetical protein